MTPALILAAGAILGAAAVWLGQRCAREHQRITAGTDDTFALAESLKRPTKLQRVLAEHDAAEAGLGDWAPCGCHLMMPVGHPPRFALCAEHAAMWERGVGQ